LMNTTSKKRIAQSGFSARRAFAVLSLLGTIGMGAIAMAFTSRGDWETIFVKARESRKSATMLICVGIAYYFEYVLNFMVTEAVSEVVFSVLDVCRRLAIVLTGAFLFSKPLSLVNAIGVVCAMVGVLLFTLVKRSEEKEEEEEEERDRGKALSSSSSSSDPR
jgi:hypothetical protein